VSGARRPATTAAGGQTTGRTIGGPPRTSGPAAAAGGTSPARASGPHGAGIRRANMDSGGYVTPTDGNDVISGAATSRRSSDVMLPSSFCMMSSPFCC